MARRELDEQNEKMLQDLTARSQRATMLAQMGELLQSCMSKDEIFAAALGFAPKIFPTRRGFIALLNAAHDLADVIRALHPGPVDLYGDSYGSWFAQSFASRYPRLLRSVVLDSTYSLVHLSPWYASSATTARSAFRLVCARDLACTDQAGGDPWRRLTQMVARLRERPIAGWTHTPQSGRVHET